MKSDLSFVELTKEEIDGFGASMVDSLRTRIGDGQPNRFVPPGEEGMKHRVHYAVRGHEGTFQALIERSYDKDDQDDYANWCSELERTLAEIHEAHPKDVSISMVVTL